MRYKKTIKRLAEALEKAQRLGHGALTAFLKKSLSYVCFIKAAPAARSTKPCCVH